MEFLELIEKRQSVRAYERGAVDLGKLAMILDAVNRAPSAGNFQAYEIYVAPQARLEALAACTFHQDFVAKADLALIVCTHAELCKYDNPEQWAIQDASIAATYAHLAITDSGLSTCWVGAFDPAKVAALIQAPAGVVPMAILPVAAAAEQPERTPRRPLSSLVHRVE